MEQWPRPRHGTYISLAAVWCWLSLACVPPCRTSSPPPGARPVSHPTGEPDAVLQTSKGASTLQRKCKSNYTFSDRQISEIKRENFSLLDRLSRVATKPGEYAVLARLHSRPSQRPLTLPLLPCEPVHVGSIRPRAGRVAHQITRVACVQRVPLCADVRVRRRMPLRPAQRRRWRGPHGRPSQQGHGYPRTRSIGGGRRSG